MTVLQMFFTALHEQNFGKTKICDGIEVFSFSIEKVLKKYAK